jgi:hypothetical protein
VAIRFSPCGKGGIHWVCGGSWRATPSHGCGCTCAPTPARAQPSRLRVGRRRGGFLMTCFAQNGWRERRPPPLRLCHWWMGGQHPGAAVFPCVWRGCWGCILGSCVLLSSCVLRKSDLSRGPSVGKYTKGVGVLEATHAVGSRWLGGGCSFGAPPPASRACYRSRTTHAALCSDVLKAKNQMIHPTHLPPLPPWRRHVVGRSLYDLRP